MSTGSKRRIDKRMEVSKEKNGQVLQDISVIGEITVKKDLVYNSTRMAISMRECGLWIKSTDKVHIGALTEINLDVNIQVIGSRIRNMEEEHSSLKITIDTMDIGSMECLKEKEE